MVDECDVIDGRFVARVSRRGRDVAAGLENIHAKEYQARSPTLTASLVRGARQFLGAQYVIFRFFVDFAMGFFLLCHCAMQICLWGGDGSQG